MKTGKLNNRDLIVDGIKLDNIVNPMLFKGSINIAANFPTLITVQNGWVYRILADVTDNDVTKTNTGQSFLTDAEIAWNGTNWTDLGYGQVKSVAGKTGIVTLISSDVNLGNVTNDAQLKRVAGDINTFDEKISLADNDLFLIEDSDFEYEKKKVKKSNAITNLSNVVFSFTLSDPLTAAATVNGIYAGAALKGAVAGIIGYYYWAVVEDVFKTIITSKFKKIAGISTITIYAQTWQSGTTAGNNMELKVSIGSVTQTVAGTDQQQTPEWLTPFALDVSGLVNGTVYDVTIQIRQNNGGGRLAYLSNIIGIAS